MNSLIVNLKLAFKLSKIKPQILTNILRAIESVYANPEDEFLAYQLAEKTTASIYPKYKFSEYSRIFLEDEEFINYYKGIMDVDNWHSMDRKYTLNQLLKLCLSLDGDLVECGAYKGASAYLMCKMFTNYKKHVHLFDSFEGLSQPNPRDGDYWSLGSLSTSEESIMETLKNYHNYSIYKGWIPSRFEEVSTKKFCFVHIDVDLYQPTLDSLTFFYDRLVERGIILLDDYGFKNCPGARDACDIFFKNKEPIINLPTGQAFVIKD